LLPNSAPEGLLEVGRIGKPHGVRGDVFLSLTSDLEQRRSVGSELIIIEGGKQRTLTIATVRPQQDRWVVHFEGIDDRNAVEKLTNKYLYAEPIEGAEGLWVHQLIGSDVVDMAGTSWGTCTGVLHNPAHDLLESWHQVFSCRFRLWSHALMASPSLIRQKAFAKHCYLTHLTTKNR